MPQQVIAGVEEVLGGSVVRATTALGGFTPGPAAACDLDDGRRVFVKACCSELSELATTLHRREARVLAALPAEVPAPAFVASTEVGDWVAVISEWIEGTTPQAPLDAVSIEAALDLVNTLAVAGRECPIDDLDRVGDHPHERSNRWAWKKLADADMSDQLDPWSQRHLTKLVQLEEDWIDAASGDALLHRDLRTDNMILGVERAVAVDWPVASRGAPWVDLVGMLPSFHLNGAPEPKALFTHHRVGADAEPAAVDCYLAALAGYFTRQALLPPVRPGTELRQLQSKQGQVCRDWLSTRFGWE